MLSLRRAFLFLAVAAVAGCGGGSVSLVPHHAGPTSSPTAAPTNKPTATPKPTAAPTATPSSGATLAPAAVSSALASVQTYYATLPHTNLSSDLSALATEMVSSHVYKQAAVNPGGITATLPDGTTAVVFADRMDDFTSTSSSATQTASIGRGRKRAIIGGPGGATSHEMAFLINSSDPLAFNQNTYLDYASSLTNLGFNANAGYQSEAIDATLDNIVALGTSHPLDFLDLETHGNVAGLPSFPQYLAMESSTPYSATDTVTPTKYASDIAHGRVFYSVYLSDVNNPGIFLLRSNWGFTMDFLLEHLQFNPGALFYSGACFGANQATLPGIEAKLQGALPNPVGRYDAWTKSVGAGDDAQSLGFMLDRAIGEQSPPLGYFANYVSQRNPPQRPFPLDDVQTQMMSEPRELSTTIPRTSVGPYTFSDPNDPENGLALPLGVKTSTLVFDDRGADALSNDPLFYRMPSIASMQVEEGPTGGNLRITGSFPYTPGGVQITDSSGPHLLVPTNWTSTEVDAPVPDTGPGSAGLVQVLNANSTNSVGGNLAPLTSWDAALTATENDTIDTMLTYPGTGMGTIVTQFSITFRSDVHPTVPSVDASPVPQNLYFSNVEGQSTGSFTTYSGAYVSDDQTLEGAKNDQPLTVDFSLSPTAPTLTWGQNPLSGSTFGLAARTNQPPGTCNNGQPGPQAGLTNAFCPAIGYASDGVSMCTDDASGQACAYDESPGAFFGLGGTDGLLIFTMDPSTYNITVSSQPASTNADHFAGTARMAVGSVTGSVGTPQYAPLSTTPAIRHVQRRGPPRSAPHDRARSPAELSSRETYTFVNQRLKTS